MEHRGSVKREQGEALSELRGEGTGGEGGGKGAASRKQGSTAWKRELYETV